MLGLSELQRHWPIREAGPSKKGSNRNGGGEARKAPDTKVPPPNENGGGIKMGQRGFINPPVGGEREIMETTCHFAVESQTLRGNLEGEILRSD